MTRAGRDLARRLAGAGHAAGPAGAWLAEALAVADPELQPAVGIEMAVELAMSAGGTKCPLHLPPPAEGRENTTLRASRVKTAA